MKPVAHIDERVLTVGSGSMPKPSPIGYRTTNRSGYDAAGRKRGPLSVWFDPEMVRQAGKTGKRGRSETFSDAAIQTCPP